jgi:hypothetical protein|tara:strand:+ start:329 stop:520 length:192 start_codon:yes stop_codon:yes gene_type:complete
MHILQMIKDYLEEKNSRNELVNPETLLEEIEGWSEDNENYQDITKLKNVWEEKSTKKEKQNDG